MMTENSTVHLRDAPKNTLTRIRKDMDMYGRNTTDHNGIIITHRSKNIQLHVIRKKREDGHSKKVGESVSYSQDQQKTEQQECSQGHLGPSFATGLSKEDAGAEFHEVREFFEYALRDDATYNGTVCFCLSATERSPAIEISVRVNSKENYVESWVGKPPDGKVSCVVEISKDDFFLVYSGKASTAEIGKMCLSGRIKVHWFRYRELQKFANCFDFSTETWIRFYDQRHDYKKARELEAVDMVRSGRFDSMQDAVQELFEEGKLGTKETAEDLNLTLTDITVSSRGSSVEDVEFHGHWLNTGISHICRQPNAAYTLIRASATLHGLSSLLCIRQSGIWGPVLQTERLNASDIRVVASTLWPELVDAVHAETNSEKTNSSNKRAEYRSSWGFTAIYNWFHGSEESSKATERSPASGRRLQSRKETHQRPAKKGNPWLHYLKSHDSLLPFAALCLAPEALSWIPPLHKRLQSDYALFPGVYTLLPPQPSTVQDESHYPFGTLLSLFFDMTQCLELFKQPVSQECMHPVARFSHPLVFPSPFGRILSCSQLTTEGDQHNKELFEAAKRSKPSVTGGNISLSDRVQYSKMLCLPQGYSLQMLLSFRASLSSHLNALSYLHDVSIFNLVPSNQTDTETHNAVNHQPSYGVPLETGHYPRAPSGEKSPPATPTVLLDHVLNHHLTTTPYVLRRGAGQLWNAYLLDAPNIEASSKSPSSRGTNAWREPERIRTPKDFASNTISTIKEGLPYSKNSALNYAFADSDSMLHPQRVSYYPYVRLPRTDFKPQNKQPEKNLDPRDINRVDAAEDNDFVMRHLAAPGQRSSQLSSIPVLPLWLSCSSLPLGISGALSSSFRSAVDQCIKYKLDEFSPSFLLLRRAFDEAASLWNSESWKYHVHTVTAASCSGALKPWHFIEGSGPTTTVERKKATYSSIWEMFLKPYGFGIENQPKEAVSSRRRAEPPLKNFARKMVGKADAALSSDSSVFDPDSSVIPRDKQDSRGEKTTGNSP
eukprot:gb/GECG01011174.1/.p1 GENE.gb/GECG01011174.1/~~gb/GECG01011174.1/.p1  ORF type:complete len:1003 (+),score=89.81 gb/GECG01011174.1/:1-3009(+)